MRSFLVSAGVAIAILSLGASAVLADVIPGPIVTKNGTTTLFQTNGFESDTAGTAPSVTMTGSWALLNGTDDPVNPANNHSLVYAGGGTRPASQGANLLEVLDKSGGSGNTHAKAVFGTAAATTDTLRAKYDLYIETADVDYSDADGPSFMANFMPTASGSYQDWWGAAFQGSGANFEDLLDDTGIGATDMYLCYVSGGAWHNTKLADGVTNMYLSLDTWHSVQMDLVPNTSLTVTIDGVVSEAMPLMGTTATDVAGLDFHVNTGFSDTRFYLDGPPVPEPSAIVLLATGAIGLLAYAWRKRK